MAKYAGRGLVLDIAASDVGQVVSGLDGIGGERALIDASAYGDEFMDYVLGQKDGSEFTLVIAYDPIDTEHLALLAAFESSAVTAFGLTHAEAGWGCQFSGIVRAITRGGPRDGLMSMNVTIKITTDVTEGS